MAASLFCFMLYIKKENTLTDTYSLLLSKVMTELYMEGVCGRIRALFGIKKTIFFVVHAKPDVRLWLEQATGGFLCCAAGRCSVSLPRAPLCMWPIAATACNRIWPDKQTTEHTHTFVCIRTYSWGRPVDCPPFGQSA